LRTRWWTYHSPIESGLGELALLLPDAAAEANVDGAIAECVMVKTRLIRVNSGDRRRFGQFDAVRERC
jgi:hypothetical protein